MRHDLHHIYCDCTLAEYGDDCGEAVAACRRLTTPTCSACNGRIMIRVLEYVDGYADDAGVAVAYSSSHPMPVSTFLAGLNARMN